MRSRNPHFLLSHSRKGECLRARHFWENSKVNVACSRRRDGCAPMEWLRLTLELQQWMKDGATHFLQPSAADLSIETASRQPWAPARFLRLPDERNHRD